MAPAFAATCALTISRPSDATAADAGFSTSRRVPTLEALQSPWLPLVLFVPRTQ